MGRFRKATIRMVWWPGGEPVTFVPSSTAAAMNPLAILAFLMGMNTTPPPPPAAPEQKERSEQQQAKPKPQGPQKKARGGWDHN